MKHFTNDERQNVMSELTAIQLTPEQLEIMLHTRDRADRGFYDRDSPAMQALVQAGLMECAGRIWLPPEPYFRLTPLGIQVLLGREALRTATAPAPAPATAAQ